jgi:ABC-type phosphate/phosphonate transport system substrate-binding protein
MKWHRRHKWCGPVLATGLLAVSALPFGAAGGEHAADAEAPGLRIAISESIAGEVNSNDLRAAVRAWADSLARGTGIRIEPELCTTEQLMQRVRNQQVDGFSVNFLEFARVASYASRELVLEAADVTDGPEFMLLVHQSGGIHNLADLRGRSLLLYQNPRTCMDRMWLDTQLAAAHLGAAEAVMGRIESSTKLARVVLPVFFRQADACLVTRQGYSTMCELNPQLAKQLRPLATSPKLVMTMMAFHKDSPLETKRRFVAAVTGLHQTVAGRQALMLFGATQLVPADISALRTSFDLLHTYERLKDKAPAAGQ